MKMKNRVFAMVMCLVMVCMAAGCGASSDNGQKTGNSSGEPENAATENADTAAGDSSAEDVDTGNEAASGSGDALVIYFSRTGEQYGVGVIDRGNTAIVADMIAGETGADTFEILPQEDYYPYTYNELTELAKQEQQDNARPAYAGEVPDLSGYSTIFIGAPVWWGDWPMIMYTFFENNAEQLAGKTLIPFCTHAGSGLSGFDQKLAAACPGSTVGEGLAIEGTDAQEQSKDTVDAVHEWLSEVYF